MNEFLKTWYGLTLFIIFDAAAVLAVMAIAYRWVFKRVWDALASIVCMAVLSPLYLAIFGAREDISKEKRRHGNADRAGVFCGKKGEGDRSARLPHDGRRRKRSGTLRQVAETYGVL